MNEFELREKLLSYTSRNYEALVKAHTEWNQRLAHGVPIATHLMYDLFGHTLSSAVKEELLLFVNSDKFFININADIWVNEENPFQVLFVYKVWSSTSEGSEEQYFQLGDEASLIAYCEERELVL
ncbi:hypothetical protein ACFX4N_24370 [Priestia sp. YIM B13551]|uniref:hypothetical protein n=1 Tax=Priestia sp. YIM B13551 TaxID=3366306 RepID=UPI00366F951D